MTKNVKSCPLCGSTNLIFKTKIFYRKTMFTISCKFCGCGAIANDFDVLFEKWNKRRKSKIIGSFEFTDEKVKEYGGTNG